MRAWTVLLACLLTLGAVAAGAWAGGAYRPAGDIADATSGGHVTGGPSEAAGGSPSETSGAGPGGSQQVPGASEEAQGLPFTGVPEANAELDTWLVEHPAEDPRIVVTISDGPRAEAVVHLYDGERLVGTLYGFGGPPDNPTIVGDYKVKLRLGTVHTGLYRKELGHEFWLRDFIQIKGNYGFHAYKINDATNEEEPGPTHGCVTLPAGDEAALFQWVQVGTPVSIQYVNADTASQGGETAGDAAGGTR